MKKKKYIFVEQFNLSNLGSLLYLNVVEPGTKVKVRWAGGTGSYSWLATAGGEKDFYFALSLEARTYMCVGNKSYTRETTQSCEVRK